jgi:hypothetical protein
VKENYKKYLLIFLSIISITEASIILQEYYYIKTLKFSYETVYQIFIENEASELRHLKLIKCSSTASEKSGFLKVFIDSQEISVNNYLKDNNIDPKLKVPLQESLDFLPASCNEVPSKPNVR